MPKRINVEVLGERGDELARVVGTNILPVIDSLPRTMNIKRNGKRNGYLIDFDALDNEISEKLKRYLAMRFSLTPQQLQEQIEHDGVPVLLEHCRVLDLHDHLN